MEYCKMFRARNNTLLWSLSRVHAFLHSHVDKNGKHSASQFVIGSSDSTAVNDLKVCTEYQIIYMRVSVIIWR